MIDSFLNFKILVILITQYKLCLIAFLMKICYFINFFTGNLKVWISGKISGLQPNLWLEVATLLFNI